MNVVSDIKDMQKNIIQEQEKECYKIENINSVANSSL